MDHPVQSLILNPLALIPGL